MEYLSLLLSLFSCVLLILLLLRSKKTETRALEEVLHSQFQKEFMMNREELAKNLQENRKELTQSIDQLNETLNRKAKEDREELRITLKDFQDSFSKKC